MGDAFEKVKIELRSILLSSKHGVADTDIQNDYEQLTCQMLMYRELGFQDVLSLMRAMPDVAKEVRSPNGQIIYHAVCDESTAHIQKLVSNQTTKKKNVKYVRGRARGRGGHGVARGGRSGFVENYKPTFLQTSNQGRPMRPFPASSRAAHNSSTNRNESFSSPFRNQITREEEWNVSTIKDENRNSMQMSRANIGSSVGAAERARLSGTNHDDDELRRITSPIYNLKIGVGETGRRFISTSGSPLGKNGDGNGFFANEGVFAPGRQFDLRDTINRRHSHRTSAVGNHGDNDGAVGGSEFNMDIGRNRRVMRENRYPSKQNLPPRLQKKQDQYNGPVLQTRQALLPMPVLTNSPPHFSHDNTVYFIEKNNWVPPENGQQYLRVFYNYFVQRKEQIPEITITPAKIKDRKGFYGHLLYNDKYYYPLEIMQTEEQAEQNLARSFCLKNNISLVASKQQDKPTQNQFSSSVNQTSQRLSQDQSGAETNNVESPAAVKSPTVVKPPSHESFQSQTSHSEPVVTSDHQKPCLPEILEKIYKMLKPNGTWVSNIADVYQTTYGEALTLDFLSLVKQWPDYFTLEQLAGNRYTVYPVVNVLTKETSVDVTSKVKEKEDSQITNKVTEKEGSQITNKVTEKEGSQITNKVTEKEGSQITNKVTEKEGSQITNKVTEKEGSQITNKVTEKEGSHITSKVTEKKDSILFVPVPQALQPAVGSEVQVLFSFAYSATDLYVQRADMENLVYDIDEMLNENCPDDSAPEVDAIAVNSLMAANYEGSWYRAQVVTVEIPIVTVYFIDYGNTEKVNISDLRPIPHEQLTLDTSSLAIKCAVRKSKTGEWCKDVTAVFTELAESYPPLTATILEHNGDQCVIDLCTPEGRLVNDMLIEAAPTPPPQQINTTPQRTGSLEQGKRLSFGSPSAKLFADDPEPLLIPESQSFVVYVCRVMSESAVLLRIVDDDYSEKLDQVEQCIAENFYNWPVPKELHRGNIYAGMVLAGVDEADYDEEDREKVSDQNKYHRVRLLRAKKDGTCDCYLPDHGHDQVLNVSQLREIDPIVNLSLSYQAVMAKLHGLDKLPDTLKPMAVRMLIKLLINSSTFYAIKRGKCAENGMDRPVGVDATVMIRVRKIISMSSNVEPAFVSQIYHDVYKESVDNMEEIIKNIPGFGYWKESLIVDLIDTSQDDNDVNINEWTLAVIEEMQKVQSEGGNIEDVWRNHFSSNASQTDTDSGSFHESLEGFTGKDSLQSALNNLGADQNGIDIEAKLSRVQKYVEDLKPAAQEVSAQPVAGRVLYTWNTKSETQGSDVSLIHTPATSLPSSLQYSVCDISSLPRFWTYPLLKLVSLQIVRVESPSYFVVIPMGQRGALEKLEMAIAQYYSSHSAEPATNYSHDVLYAIKSQGVYQRSLYVDKAGDLVKVFLPDHHSYDTVSTSQLFLLPQQFYSLPFLAHQACLGGVVPTEQNWPENVIHWFKNTINNKCMYGMITREEQSISDPRLSGTIVVQLIDTSGPEDLVVDEYMESQGMAALDKIGNS